MFPALRSVITASLVKAFEPALFVLVIMTAGAPELNSSHFGVAVQVSITSKCHSVPDHRRSHLLHLRSVTE